MFAKATSLSLIFFASLVSATSNEKLSEVQITELAVQVSIYVSKDFHVSEAPSPLWIWLTLPEKRFPKLSASIRKALSKKYTIVTKQSELPNEALYAGHTYTSWNGFMLEIEARYVRPRRIGLTYSYYGGPMAPSRQSVQYEWTSQKWKVAFEGNTAIY